MTLQQLFDNLVAQFPAVDFKISREQIVIHDKYHIEADGNAGWEIGRVVPEPMVEDGFDVEPILQYVGNL